MQECKCIECKNMTLNWNIGNEAQSPVPSFVDWLIPPSLVLYNLLHTGISFTQDNNIARVYCYFLTVEKKEIEYPHSIFLMNSIFLHFTGVLVLKNGSLVYDKYELTFVSKYCIRSYKSWIFVVEVKADGDSWFNFVWFLDNRNRYDNIPIRRRNRIVIATIRVDFLLSRWLLRDIMILRFCDSCFALLYLFVVVVVVVIFRVLLYQIVRL